jgi:hypothetical protein
MPMPPPKIASVIIISGSPFDTVKLKDEESEPSALRWFALIITKPLKLTAMLKTGSPSLSLKANSVSWSSTYNDALSLPYSSVSVNLLAMTSPFVDNPSSA